MTLISRILYFGDIMFEEITDEMCILFRADALQKNQDLEFERNKERFMFLKVNILSTYCGHL